HGQVVVTDFGLARLTSSATPLPDASVPGTAAWGMALDDLRSEPPATAPPERPAPAADPPDPARSTGPPERPAPAADPPDPARSADPPEPARAAAPGR